MLETCTGCGTRYAPDLAACPHCGTAKNETGHGVADLGPGNVTPEPLQAEAAPAPDDSAPAALALTGTGAILEDQPALGGGGQERAGGRERLQPPSPRAEPAAEPEELEGIVLGMSPAAVRKRARDEQFRATPEAAMWRAMSGR